MRYIPPVTFKQHADNIKGEQTVIRQKIDQTLNSYYDIPRNPVSDTTNFIVVSTTIDSQKIEDERFKIRNELFLLATDKFSALAALTNEDQALTTLMWQDLLYSIKFQFWDRAERKAIEIIRVYNESRGREGQYNFSEQLITQREILISKHKQEQEEQKKKGFFGNIMTKKEPVENQLQGGQNI